MREIRYVIAVGGDGRRAWRRKYRGPDGARDAAAKAARWGDALVERRGRAVQTFRRAG